MMLQMSRSRVLVLAFACGVLVAVLAVAGCGGSSSTTGGGISTDPSGGEFEGATANPPKPAPPLALDNYLGQPVNLKEYRGKAVFITFIYVHCPDICPIIVSNMRAAQEDLGSQAKEAQFIAVSVDPENDTPEAVGDFLQARQMTGRMQYLIGSRPELERVWQQWSVASKHDPRRKDPDFVEHSALIYGISGSGKITTLYPGNFKPGQLVHDAPILATE
jgi:protein SCO1/2